MRTAATVLFLSSLLSLSCGLREDADDDADSTTRAGEQVDQKGTCRANIVLIRHGEKPPDHAIRVLSRMGEDRAAYIGRCGTHSSPALWLGPPTAIMAAKVKRGKSSRSLQTVIPLARALGLVIEHSVAKDRHKKFAKKALKKLDCGKTLFVSWEHKEISGLVRALRVPNADTPDFSAWPLRCGAFHEPVSRKHGNRKSSCYDQMWQITLSKETAAQRKWTVGNAVVMKQGWGGRSDSPCAGDFVWGSTQQHNAHVHATKGIVHHVHTRHNNVQSDDMGGHGSGRSF